MSSSTCSPAAAVIQKLFKCSSFSNHKEDSGLDVICSGSGSGSGSSSNSNSNSDRNAKDIKRDGCLFLTTKKYNNNIFIEPENLDLCSKLTVENNKNFDFNFNSVCNSNNNNNNNNNKSTRMHVKSNLVAKKMKFLKFLEEEKCRLKHKNYEHFEQRNRGPSNDTIPIKTIEMSTATSDKQLKMLCDDDDVNVEQTAATNFVLKDDIENDMGFTCTLCDNCRCFDCQARYFDCDDFDCNSELSYTDEFDDFDYFANESQRMIRQNFNKVEQQSNETERAQCHKCGTGNCKYY